MRSSILASTLAAALLASAQATAGETFRCGTWIISDELTVGELASKCGKPASKEFQVVEVRGKASSGSVPRGTTTIEHWTYEFANGSTRYVVTIIDGAIKDIQRAK